MCDVPSIAVFCSESIECFPGKNLEAVPGKHSIDSVQKTAILGTSHIIRKVLQCEA